MSTTRPRIVGYIRSATNTGDVLAQRVALQTHAYALGLDLVEVLEDSGDAAPPPDRPGIRSAIAFLERGAADGLLVHRVDRISRVERELLEFFECYFADGRYVLLSILESIDTRKDMSRKVVLTILRFQVALVELETSADVSDEVRERMIGEFAATISHEIGASRPRD